ncbi:MAG: CapA family protein [Deltaproteobacteria bacterium]|nr:CapA family protein [Deltaproteobacteria bacterium]
MKSMIVIPVACICIFSTFQAAGSAAGGDSVSSRRMYKLFASGDTMLARWAHYVFYDRGPKWMLGPIKNLIKDADIAQTNLECVVATTGKFWDKGERRPYAYRARPEMLDVLTDMGFDIVSAGNNHSMDYGPKALLEEFELLKQAGIAWYGAGVDIDDAFRPRYVKVGDLILAFLGLEDQRSLMGAKKDQPGAAYAHGVDGMLQALRGPVAEARKHANLVIFSPHWGPNWTDRPDKDRIAVAHGLVDMGVDLIIGHSAHQFHGIEIYKGCPIIYDMGSLLFDRVGQGRMRFGAAFVLEFDIRGFHKVIIHPIRLQRNRTTIARGRDAELVRSKMIELSREFDKNVRFEEQKDGSLTLALRGGNKAVSGITDPKEIHIAGTTRRLPDKFRKRYAADVVPRSPLPWIKGKTPVDIGHGITVLGWTGSEAARPGRAFVHQVAIKVSMPIGGGWFSRLEGKQRNGKGAFHLWYPFADGAYLPNLWKPGQVVVDRTLARPPVLPPGLYDLYWGLQGSGSARIPDRRMYPSTPGNLLPVGSMRIMARGIPKGPAGVSWNGKLPERFKKHQKRSSSKKGEVSGAGLAWGLSIAALVVIAVVGLIVFKHRKGGSLNGRK